MNNGAQLVIENPGIGEIIIQGVKEHDVTFSHEIAGTLNVTAAEAWCKEHTKEVVIELDVLNVLKSMLDIDLHDARLIQLADEDTATLMKSKLFLHLEWSDGTHILIDGNHTLATIAARAARAGVERFRVRSLIIPYDQHHQFKVRFFEKLHGERARELSTMELLNEIRGVYTNPDGTLDEGSVKRRDAGRYG